MGMLISPGVILSVAIQYIVIYWGYLGIIKIHYGSVWDIRSSPASIKGQRPVGLGHTAHVRFQDDDPLHDFLVYFGLVFSIM